MYRKYLPAWLGYKWPSSDTGLPRFFCFTNWWSFSLNFCCKRWGFRFCYFTQAQTHHALESGFALWGKQSSEAGEYPQRYYGYFWRIGFADV